MPVDLDLTLARRVVADVCAAHHVTLVPPDHLDALYRGALVGALATWRAVKGRPVALPDTTGAPAGPARDPCAPPPPGWGQALSPLTPSSPPRPWTTRA